MRRLAIADIHGCACTFRKLVEEELNVSAKDQLYLLGDYINKGPDSKGVLDYLFHLQSAYPHIEILRGNHDQLMLDARKDNEHYEKWKSQGGDATLQSFGVSSPGQIPENYYDLLQSLKYWEETDDFMLVHAGFDFREKDIFDHREAMLTIREMHVKKEMINGKRLVHGHVPQSLVSFTSKLSYQWDEISIDTGCVYTDRQGMGYLTALDLDTLESTHLKNID